MSLRGRIEPEFRPDPLARIVETGRVKKPSSCLPEGLGMQKWEESPVAARIDQLMAKNTAARAPRGTGGRKAHKKVLRKQRLEQSLAAQEDLVLSYEAALAEMPALNTLDDIR